jgi:hypothetical protein
MLLEKLGIKRNVGKVEFSRQEQFSLSMRNAPLSFIFIIFVKGTNNFDYLSNNVARLSALWKWYLSGGRLNCGLLFIG